MAVVATLLFIEFAYLAIRAEYIVKMMRKDALETQMPFKNIFNKILNNFKTFGTLINQ